MNSFIFAVQNKWIHLFVIDEFIELLWARSANRKGKAGVASM